MNSFSHHCCKYLAILLLGCALSTGCGDAPSGQPGASSEGKLDRAALAEANGLDPSLLDELDESALMMLPRPSANLADDDRSLRVIKAAYFFGDRHMANDDCGRAMLAFGYVDKKSRQFWTNADFGEEAKRLGHDAALGIATCLAKQGQTDESLAVLLKAFEDGFQDLQRVEKNAVFDAVRALPGYQPLAEYYEQNPPVIEPYLGPGS